MQGSKYHHNNLLKNILSYTQSYGLISLYTLGAIAGIATITGCNEQQTWQEISDDNGHILIGQTTVTLTPKHIIAIKSEQYQPSLTLIGRIVPNQQTTLTAPTNIQLSNLMVKQAQQVKKEEPLFTLTKLNPTLADTPQNVVAPFDGRITQIYYKNIPSMVDKGSPILKIDTPNQLKFIGLLPFYTQSRISIGQHVNFTVNSSQNNNKTDNTLYTGQVSEVIELPNSHKVAVHVHVLPDDGLPTLPVGTSVQGKLNYGQLDIATIVTAKAVHGDALSIFKQTDHQILAPVKAHVWIVNQDSSLAYQPVEVIRYDESSDNFLVSGIPSESLIVTANLPKTADGKRLKIS